MLYRKVFKIKNSCGHVIGLCWAVSIEESKNYFCKKISPPYELISEGWKTTAYFKVLDNKDLETEEYEGYKVKPPKKNEGYIIEFSDEIFDNTEIYETLEFKQDEPHLIRVVKLYKTGNKCPKDGKYFCFNKTAQPQECLLDEQDEFGNLLEGRSYFYYIEK